MSKARFQLQNLDRILKWQKALVSPPPRSPLPVASAEKLKRYTNLVPELDEMWRSHCANVHGHMTLVEHLMPTIATNPAVMDPDVNLLPVDHIKRDMGANAAEPKRASGIVNTMIQKETRSMNA
eukprot:GHVN01051038.1.p1 GENE.GHVN01051038.1~~GHVN01051038.1.p1  ORF type:complete len:124 (+),score=13.86 GHVN01051038.1:162-533(+)